MSASILGMKSPKYFHSPANDFLTFLRLLGMEDDADMANFLNDIDPELLTQISDSTGNTLLHVACLHKNHIAVSMILARIHGYQLPLMETYQEHFENMTFSYDSNVSTYVQQLNQWGVSPLLDATLVNDANIVLRLCQCGALSGQMTPLPSHASRTPPLVMAASTLAGEEVMRTLLKYGAAPNSVDSVGKSALTWCVERQNVAGVKRLLCAGANPNWYYNGRTPLHVAAGEVHNALLVKLLLDLGSNPNARTYSCRHGSSQALQLAVKGSLSYHLVKHAQENCPTLAHLCRIRIRQCCSEAASSSDGLSLKARLRKLHLPRTLTNYLLYDSLRKKSANELLEELAAMSAQFIISSDN